MISNLNDLEGQLRDMNKIELMQTAQKLIKLVKRLDEIAHYADTSIGTGHQADMIDDMIVLHVLHDQYEKLTELLSAFYMEDCDDH